MSNTREKLIELIRKPIAIMPGRTGTPYITFTLPYAEELADHLIANGVTLATDNNVGDKLTPTDKDTNVLTNADRIRAMSDEELAEFLCGVYDEENGGVYQDECGKFINGTVIFDYDQYKIEEWLEQPAEVPEGD